MAVDLTLLSQLEDQHDLPPGLLRAVMQRESNGNANAESPKGARGYFQFMPATAKAYGVDDPSDFKQSATGAARYLADLKKQYAGDLTKTLAAYNAGPTPVAQYKGVPPFPETQAYVQNIMSKLAEDAPPDISNLPPDISKLNSGMGGAAWGGETNARPAPRDFGKEIGDATSPVWPIAGSIAGGIAGGAVGAGAAGPVGGATGTVVGGGIGNFIGNLAAISDAEQSGKLTELPVSEKLKYALKQAGIDMGSSIAMFGVLKAMPAIVKFFKPSQISEVEDFFRQAGVETPRPRVGAMAEWNPKVYHEAVRDMRGAVDDAVNGVVSQLDAKAGSPTALGTTFKDALNDAYTRLGDKVNGLYAGFQRGTTVGDSATTVGKDFQTWASKRIQDMKDKGSWDGLDDTLKRFITEVSEGGMRVAPGGAPGAVVKAPLTVAEMLKMKQGIYEITDFAKSEGQQLAKRGFDQSTKTEMASEIDKALMDSLSGNPAALRNLKAANAIYADGAQALKSDLMLQVLKKDPLSVTDYVAQQASPTTVKAFEDAMDRARRLGALTPDMVDSLRAGVQQSWITRNLKDPNSMADLAESLTSAKNHGLRETFYAVFSSNPQLRATVEQAAKAARAASKFESEIPPASVSGAGSYSMTGAAGYMAGGAAGSVAAMGLLRLYTHTIPTALANAAMNSNTAVLNRIRAVTTWFTNSMAAGRPVQEIPNAVMESIRQIENTVAPDQPQNPLK